ncbi:DUF6906 family protein [Bacillus cereus]|uniref:DUF6906 family protein n=1 Tax=Bacillus cereus TaxID=1396 RepID=UPI003F6E43A3
MKQGGNPTKREKILIKSHNLNPNNRLICKEVAQELHLVRWYANTTRVITNS